MILLYILQPDAESTRISNIGLHLESSRHFRQSSGFPESSHQHSDHDDFLHAVPSHQHEAHHEEEADGDGSAPNEMDEGDQLATSAPTLPNATYVVTHPPDTHPPETDDMGSYEVPLAVEESSLADVTPHPEGHSTFEVTYEIVKGGTKRGSFSKETHGLALCAP